MHGLQGLKGFLLLALVMGSGALRAQDSAPAASAPQAPQGRERLSLDKGWRFHLGDVPFPVITGHEASYANAKAGKAWGAAAPDYDDHDWRVLNLPHDWVVEGPLDPNANLSQGYRPRGISAWPPTAPSGSTASSRRGTGAATRDSTST
jgi:hypothetical protein